jgi:hypothetical protein
MLEAAFPLTLGCDDGSPSLLDAYGIYLHRFVLLKHLHFTLTKYLPKVLI